MDGAETFILAQARAGNRDAFRTLVERHSRAVFRVAYRVTGNEQDAEDVVQDTFLKAFAEVSRFEARSGLGTWLHRSAVVVERLAREDRDDDYQEHLTFVLTLVGDRGIDTLIGLAKRDPSAKVRGQALFWLGQSGDDRAVGFFEEVLRR